MKFLSIILVFTFFSITLFGQKNAPPFYSSSDDIWLNALSKTESNAAVKKITNSLGATSELSDMDEFQEALHSQNRKVWNKKGMALGFSKMAPKGLNNIYFYNESSVHLPAKNLPFGLSFSDSGEKIKARYGKYLTEESDGDFTLQVYPTRYPFVFMKINMDKGKVGHAISLYYDEYAAYITNPSPHELEDNADLCEAYSAMIKDVDNKFFNFRGEKTKDLFPSWKCNVILDSYDVAETKIYHDYIKIVYYEGFDEMKAGGAYETLFSYFDFCVEEGEIPYSWNKTEKETETSWEKILTTNEKNVKIEHYFKIEKPRFSTSDKEEFSAYTLIRYSKD